MGTMLGLKLGHFVGGLLFSKDLPFFLALLLYKFSFIEYRQNLLKNWARWIAALLTAACFLSSCQRGHTSNSGNYLGWGDCWFSDLTTRNPESPI